MRFSSAPRVIPACLLALVAVGCAGSKPNCVPTLESAWIRAALPGSAMLAGYAVVRNECAANVTIVGAEGADFASIEMHATVDEGGVSRMSRYSALGVRGGTALTFAPGASHLMLIDPARELPEGAKTRIALVLADGRRVAADFVVRRDAPDAR